MDPRTQCIALAKGYYPAPPSQNEIEVARRLGARMDPKTQWKQETLQLSRAIYKRMNLMEKQEVFEFIDRYLGPVQTDEVMRVRESMSMMVGVEDVIPDAVVCPIY